MAEVTRTSGSSGTETTKASIVVITTFPVNPLMTTYTPPAYCSGFYSSSLLAVVDPFPECLPSGFNSLATSYFSPGIACPAGYATACHDTRGVQSITTVTCCPVRGDVTLSCVDPLSLAGVWANLFCTYMASGSTRFAMTVSSDGVTSTRLEEYNSPSGLNALGIRMVHQQSDLTTAVTLLSTSSSVSSAPTGGSTSPSTAPSSGMSTGTKVAIGLIIPVIALATIAGLFFYLRKRQSRQKPLTGPLLPNLEDTQAPVQLDSNQFYEMHHSAKPIYREPIELPAERY